MNPWAQIDELKKKLADERARAVAKLHELGFSGQVDARLKWDGTVWSFPGAQGRKLESRTLEGLLALAANNHPRRAS